MPGALPLFMPGGSSWMGQLQGDPDFKKLSPQSQQVFLNFAKTHPGNGDPKAFAQAMQTDPQFAAAMQEAKSVGALDHPITPFMKGLMIAIAGVGTAGVLSAALAPAAAATSVPGAGVGIGETGATVGLGGSGFGAGTAASALGPVAAGGGTTAATVPASLAAPAIVKGAAGGLWSKLAVPLLTTGIEAGTNLIGTKMQVDAAKAAAELQAKAAEEALQWQKQQYQTRQEQLAPAIGVGNNATLALGDLMGIPTPAGGYKAPASAMANYVPPPVPPAGQTPAPAPSAPQEPTVQMRAPTGQVSAVPQSQVQHFTQMGATVVQAGA